MAPNKWLVATVLLFESATAIAEVKPDGGTIVRVPDGAASSCIDGKKDAIWLTLRRVITTKDSDWLTKDNSVGVVIETLVRTDPPAPKAISFPLLAEATIGNFSDGQISIPIEYSIIDSLKLMQGQTRYTGLQIEITLINKRSKNRWGNALVALQEVTKKLPIPGDPILQSASYLLDFANRAVSMEIETLAKDDKSKGATIAVTFDPSGKCVDESFEKSGTLAVIFAKGTKGPGYVSIDQASEYCWTADLIPAFSLKAAVRPANGACPEGGGNPEFRPVTNNYTAFILNSQPVTKLHASDTDPDRASALRRCNANGFDAKDCLRASAKDYR